MSLKISDLFPDNFSVNECVRSNELGKLLQDEVDFSLSLDKKIEKTPTESVDPANLVPFPAEYDDLARLYHLCESRKVTTILEFGTGKSSLVFAKALLRNKEKYHEETREHLRRNNPYELHTVENYESWIDTVRGQFPDSLLPLVTFHLCDLKTGSFNDRLCTYYWGVPNICPDLIYLDGPDQFSPSGDLRGLSTRHQDRMPMSADLLAIEHFLQPGTLIVVDGRTANSRFLQSNFQRNWAHLYSSDYNQHFFELQEDPLGQFNRRMIDHCLGEQYYQRIRS